MLFIKSDKLLLYKRLVKSVYSQNLLRLVCVFNVFFFMFDSFLIVAIESIVTHSW